MVLLLTVYNAKVIEHANEKNHSNVNKTQVKKDNEKEKIVQLKPGVCVALYP